MQESLMNSAMAFGGGIGAEIVGDLINKNMPEQVQKMPELTEIAPAGIGVAMLYFMPGKADPLAYGMIGASGAGMSDKLLGGMMQGFNRLNLQGTQADEIAKGRQFVERLIAEGFKENQMPMGNFEEMDEEGMC